MHSDSEEESEDDVKTDWDEDFVDDGDVDEPMDTSEPEYGSSEESDFGLSDEENEPLDLEWHRLIRRWQLKVIHLGQAYRPASNTKHHGSGCYLSTRRALCARVTVKHGKNRLDSSPTDEWRDESFVSCALHLHASQHKAARHTCCYHTHNKDDSSGECSIFLSLPPSSPPEPCRTTADHRPASHPSSTTHAKPIPHPDRPHTHTLAPLPL